MTHHEYDQDRIRPIPSRATREGLKRWAAYVVAIGAVIAVMYGELWAIERAPASTVACAMAQTTDINRTLDTVLALPAGTQAADALRAKAGS